ncbi:hypothetical protein KOW79_008636 [Hemibagrus wyckioides]|uniref:ZP domain-containing protein n=2 Tax=Hemibagrus wyckioides TaxID=337641 RepID=A0A9D3NUL8_9TELE|nr:hypothetical protein KOW79_008636 [Hemibagrus wyckioides]
MNSSWSGPAETNIYQKGESVYLQVFASSSAPDQELFIQSCYATPSSNPMEKSRSVLILNKGCVSSKQSAIEFVSRQRDSINLCLDTSSLKFSQVYLHCSMVFSSAVTPDTKSCNYNKNNSRWVELTGQTSVCECCASKCKGPPSYGELKALVSTGPFTIKEEQNEEQSLSSSFNATAQVGSSTGMNGTESRTFPSPMEKGWIVGSATVSGNSKKKVPYSFPWLSQPLLSESIRVVNQDPASALLPWFPGLFVDVSPDPILKMVIDIPEQKSSAGFVGVSSQDVAPSEKAHSETTSEEKHQEANDRKSLIPERVSEVYTADLPGLRNDWDLGGDDSALEGGHSPEEELRGDVFMNYKWPQHYDLQEDMVQADAFVSPQMEKLPEKPQENEVKKLKGDDFANPGYVKKTLTFSQASDGSRSLSYEEEERSPSMDEREVRKSKLETEWRKVEEEGSPKEVEKDLMQSLLDMVRGLNKTMYGQ